jgi:methionyl aminopeptidase
VKVPPGIQCPDYADTGEPTSERAARNESARCLSDDEIAKMRTVCILGREVLDACARAVAPGVTCTEIDRVCHEASLARDCYPSPLNYVNFPKSCCTSVNEVICHGIPDDRPLLEGDIVNVDISVYHNGYHSDLNETFFVGKVDKVSYHLVKSTHECLFKAIAACKPGVRYRDMGNIISKHAHSQGLSVGKSYCGHGINTLFHTAPNVPHYEKNKAAGGMKPGHVFTIEPMINAGDLHVLAASTTLSLIPLPLPRQTASVRCFPRSTTAVT